MNPDLVIVQWWHPYFAPCYTILRMGLKKIPVIYVCHNVFPHERFPLDRFLTKLVLKKGNGFILHSNKEVEKYFVASDIVVLPYESATQSGVVQITYGFDKPCIVTKVGGLPDVVIDGKTGYVVEPLNPRAISSAVIDFYKDNKETEFVSGVQSETYKYDWDRMNEVYIISYKQRTLKWKI